MLVLNNPREQLRTSSLQKTNIFQKFPRFCISKRVDSCKVDSYPVCIQLIVLNHKEVSYLGCTEHHIPFYQFRVKNFWPLLCSIVPGNVNKEQLSPDYTCVFFYSIIIFINDLPQIFLRILYYMLHSLLHFTSFLFLPFCAKLSCEGKQDINELWNWSVLQCYGIITYWIINPKMGNYILVCPSH